MRSRRVSAAALAVVCLLFAAPNASHAQRQAPQSTSFSRPLECSWALSAVGGGLPRRVLLARNSLNFTLPAGTHVVWSFQRSGIAAPSRGQFDLSVALHAGNTVPTGGSISGPGFGTATPPDLVSCEIRASYGLRN
jgi:hypothetical protein